MKKWTLTFWLVVLVATIALMPASAQAEGPLPDVQPWMYAAMQPSGLGSVENVQLAFKRFQDDQARIYNYDTTEKWQSNYPSDVSIFLRRHGCASCNLDGTTPSYKLKIDVPVYLHDFGKVQAE